MYTGSSSTSSLEYQSLVQAEQEIEQEAPLQSSNPIGVRMFCYWISDLMECASEKCLLYINAPTLEPKHMV